MCMSIRVCMCERFMSVHMCALCTFCVYVYILSVHVGMCGMYSTPKATNPLLMS